MAVKIFQSGHQEFENWTREKDLYQNPGLLEHDHILKFISAEIRPNNVRVKFIYFSFEIM